ncbi:hypothetical protein M413DRAFT_73902, partial [Hebeloma cylindrosporum]
DSWSEQVVTLHNQYRAEYGAPSVTWSKSRYAGALSLANKCEFNHSDPQDQYGENLYAATGDASIADALGDWMSEACKWTYNNPGYSDAAGHFTQVVWKSTNQVACAIADCPAGTIFPDAASKFIVCQYTPPGNYDGEFACVPSFMAL